MDSQKLPIQYWHEKREFRFQRKTAQSMISSYTNLENIWMQMENLEVICRFPIE